MKPNITLHSTHGLVQRTLTLWPQPDRLWHHLHTQLVGPLLQSGEANIDNGLHQIANARAATELKLRDIYLGLALGHFTEGAAHFKRTYAKAQAHLLLNNRHRIIRRLALQRISTLTTLLSCHRLLQGKPRKHARQSMLEIQREFEEVLRVLKSGLHSNNEDFRKAHELETTIKQLLRKCGLGPRIEAHWAPNAPLDVPSPQEEPRTNQMIRLR